MKKPFVPFDSFERSCLPDGKPLGETMQESCRDRLAPKEDPCRRSCLPYWEATGDMRCMSIGLLEIEEADGCGNTRWTRTADPVIWELTDEQRCDEPNNRIQKKQINQCGAERWITTSELCCTPMWVDATGEDQVIDCAQSMERRLQVDGCGKTRLRSTGQPVNWFGTGETRCDPGDVYQVEQVNQCGDIRWFIVPGGCPCVPDWQPTITERCTGATVEVQEVDGCGHARWASTGAPVAWSDTGEVRCSPLGLVQIQQINQCGNLRWSTTEESCVPEEPEEPDGDVGFGLGVGKVGCYTMAAPGTIQYSIVFGSDGKLTEESSVTPAWSGNRGSWAPADQVGLYEIMCSATPPDYMTGDTWYPMPRTLTWTATAEDGQSYGRILLTTISIRRISDGQIMATTQLENIQLGVGVDCV